MIGLFGSTLSRIEYYNLIHFTLGATGHLVLYFAFALQQEIATAIVGHSLLRGTATLEIVGMNRKDRVPNVNRNLRYMILFVSISFEIALAISCLCLDWYH